MKKYPFNKKRWEHYKGCQKRYIEVGDCDPSYNVLNYLADKKKLTLEERYWLAFIYSSCYHDATAWAMFTTMPSYSEINEQNLSMWWEKYKTKLAFTTDRAKVKNFDKIVPMFLSYKKLVGESQEKKFKELETYDAIYEFLGKVYYVGRFSLFLITEVIHVLTGLPITPTGLDLVNSESCRNGLCYAIGADAWVKAKLNKQQYDYLNIMLKKLVEETQKENPKTSITYWNVETTLCAYKKYYWKTRYMGFYLDRQMKGIIDMEDNMPSLKNDWSIFWEARKQFFDNNYLGELNDWNIIRKEIMGFPSDLPKIDIGPIIRLATEKEYKEFAKLTKKDMFVRDFSGTSYRWGWKDNLYVLIDNEDVKGFAQFTICKRKDRASLYYMYVKPNCRGNAYGHLLFNYYLQKAKESKKGELYWKVGKKNKGALSFYKNHRFVPTEETEKEFVFKIKGY